MQSESSSQEQLQIYTNWANYYLRKKGHTPSVRNLQTDLKTGVLLSKIIEAVFESPIQGVWVSPANQAQELENLSSCLEFIRERGLLLDDVTNSDIHAGSLDAVFSLFYALSVHRQKIKAATSRPQTSTPLHPGDRHTSAKPHPGTRSATPPSVPPKQKKHSSNSDLEKPDSFRGFGYKEGARKQSLEETGSAPVSRGGSLDRHSLREEFRLSGRTGQSFSEEPTARSRYRLGGSLTPQHEVKKSASWLSVREASRLSEGRKASKNLSVKELVNFLEKGEIPPDENEGKKLPTLPPKPRPGRLDAKEEDLSFSFQPIEPLESGRVSLRHSYASDRDSGPPSSAVKGDVFSHKFLPSDPVTHEYSSADTPEEASEAINTFPSSQQSQISTEKEARNECPPLPPRNPAMHPPAFGYPSRRGESFLSEDRFTTVSLLTEIEPPEQPAKVQTIVASLGPSQVETSLVNSDRLPSPKTTQMISLSPGTATGTGTTGTTGSDLSSPDPGQSLQESPLVRGGFARSEERLDRGGKGKGGLVGWATKSFRRRSTPKQSASKRLPLPESSPSENFSLPTLKHASSEWNNRFPARDRTQSPAQTERHIPTLPRSISLSETLERRHRVTELGPSSSEYRPALPARRAPGEKPLTQEIQELLAGFDISLESRPRDGESPSNLYANLGPSESPEETDQLRGITPVTLDTVSIPPTVVSEGVHSEDLRLEDAEAKRDLIYKQLLFAQDQLARRDEELREVRERLQEFERKFEDSSIALSAALPSEGQTGEKKKRTKRRWLLGKSRLKSGDASESESGSSVRGRDGESLGTPKRQGERYQSELLRLQQELSSLREENARLKRELLERQEKGTPVKNYSSPLNGSKPTSPVPIPPVSIFVLTRDHNDMSQERLIGMGQLSLSGREVNWEILDREVLSAFSSHLRFLDPDSLGMEEEVGAYLVGSVRRQIGARQIGAESPLEILRGMSRPEILVDLRVLSLSNLAYQLLVPLRVLQQYVEILMRQRRVLVMGPPGAGKTHLAQCLGQYVALVTAPRLSRPAYIFLSAEKLTLPEMRRSLSATLQLESAKGKVFVFDGLSSAEELNEICAPLLSEKSDPPGPDSPYILTTLRSEFSAGLKPVLLQHGLWVVSYLWHREPVLGLLGRLLKQKIRHFQISPPDGSVPSPSPLSTQMVDWLPRAVDQLNNFIESAYSPAAVFGPGIFLSCPLGNSPLLIEKWFSQLWNEYIFPILREISSHNLQDVPTLPEITKQILKGCPVKIPNVSDVVNNMRLGEHRIRPSNGQAPSVIESEL